MAKRRTKEEEIAYFYVPDIKVTKKLSEEEANHAFRVLRLVPGTLVYITDGQGNLYSAKLDERNPKSAKIADLALVETQVLERPPLQLSMAPTKNIDRVELVVEKLTELGIEKLSLVLTERAIRRKVNLDRMHRIMVAAMKQSEKLSTVEIEVYDSMSDFVSSGNLHEGKYIGYCGEEYPKIELKECFEKGVGSTFLIGPEGDFTPEEVSVATEAGFKAVSLGRERLRVETAALYVGMLHHILND